MARFQMTKQAWAVSFGRISVHLGAHAGGMRAVLGHACQIAAPNAAFTPTIDAYALRRLPYTTWSLLLDSTRMHYQSRVSEMWIFIEVCVLYSTFSS